MRRQEEPSRLPFYPRPGSLVFVQGPIKPSSDALKRTGGVSLLHLDTGQTVWVGASGRGTGSTGRVRVASRDSRSPTGPSRALSHQREFSFFGEPKDKPVEPNRHSSSIGPRSSKIGVCRPNTSAPFGRPLLSSNRVVLTSFIRTSVKCRFSSILGSLTGHAISFQVCPAVSSSCNHVLGDCIRPSGISCDCCSRAAQNLPGA